MKRLWSLAVVVSLALLLTPIVASTAVLSPLVVGWEQFFRVRWGPSTQAGQRVVSGDIENASGFPARRIQLLVEGLDASGRVTSQRVAWLGSELTPGMRAYFMVPVSDAAPSYRISVFAFEWVQAGGGDHR